MRLRVLSVTCALAALAPAIPAWAGDVATIAGPRVVHMPGAARDPAADSVSDKARATAAAKPEQSEAKAPQAESKAPQAEIKPTLAESKAPQAESKAPQAEIKPTQAESKPTQPKSLQAQAKPLSAEPTLQQTDARPEKAGSRQQPESAAGAPPPAQAPAEAAVAAVPAKAPATSEGKSESTSDGKSAGVAARAPTRINPPAATGSARGDIAPASETASNGESPPAMPQSASAPRGADAFAMRQRKAAAKPSAQPVTVVVPPPDANVAPAYHPRPNGFETGADAHRRPERRFGAEAFPEPTARVQKIEPDKGARKQAGATPARFQNKCQASWGTVAGEGPFGVCVLN